MAGQRVDFFISYTSKDESWATWIAWVLEEAGYRATIQAWDFRPGSNFVLQMQSAAVHADRVIPVLSPDYLSASFPAPEWAAAFALDPEGVEGRLVPVMVRQCEPEGLLRGIVQIRIHDLAEEQARAHLLAGLAPGRAKPMTKPNFPGVGGSGFRDPSTVPPWPGRIPRPRWDDTRLEPGALDAGGLDTGGFAAGPVSPAVGGDPLPRRPVPPDPVGHDPVAWTGPVPAEPPDWEPVSDPVAPLWRHGSFAAAQPGPPRLELHLVPLETGIQLSSQAMSQVGERLAQVGRVKGLFTQTQGIDVRGDRHHQVAFDPRGGPDASAGLLLTSTGQRGGWVPLPNDPLGAIFDAADAEVRAAALLRALAAIEIPAPARVLPGIGVAPAGLVSVGNANHVGRRSTGTVPAQDVALLHAALDQSVSWQAVADSPEEVAKRLVARIEAVIVESR